MAVLSRARHVIAYIGAGAVAPIGGLLLGPLGLSSLAAVVGQAFSATIAGRLFGSSISATSSDGTALTIVGSALSGTFTATGSKTITIVETLAGATGSPRTSTLTLVVSTVPTLSILTLSTQAAIPGQSFSATITGRTNGSSLTATSSDGTALTVSGTTLSGTFASAGSPTITLIETLAGATGSPKSTTLTITVSASVSSGLAADLSDPIATQTFL